VSRSTSISIRSGVLSPPITFNAAHRQIDRIGDVFEMLVQNPLAGREPADIRRDLRSFPVGSYVVFYIPRPDGIEVVRVMNGRQDIDADDMGP
jgi:toxin ParE1/3/4